MEKNQINALDLFENYGRYVCNVGKIMDKLGISISKMRKLTGLNHEIVKKYYQDQVVRVDKDVLARISYIISIYGGNPQNLFEYISPEKEQSVLEK